MTWKKLPAIGIPIGLALFVVANALWSGPPSVPASTAEFADNMVEFGGGYRRGVLTNILLMVPAYTLTFLTIAAVIRRKDDTMPWRRRGSSTVMGLIGLAIPMELVGTVLALLAVGTVDLSNLGPNEVVAPPEWLVDTIAGVGTIVFVCVALAALLCIIGLIAHGIGFFTRRRSSVANHSGSVAS